MKKLFFMVISTLLVSLVIPQVLEAKLPAKCIDRLISKSEYKLKDIVSSTQKGGRIDSAYNQLKKNVIDFMEYKNGKWTQECLSAAPENITKYQNFLQTKAQPVLTMAFSRKNELCSAAAENLINKSMIEIQDKLKTDSAAPYISQFENRLKNKSMIINCAPVKERVASILTQELPNIKKNIKIGKYISALAWESSHVNSIFEDSQKAFKNKTLAPLGGTQSNSDFKNVLTSCLSNIKALDTNKYSADGLISSKGKNPITFADARKSCEEVKKYGVDKLLSKIVTNNENYAKAWKKAWEKKYILGSAMARTHKENNPHLPAKTEDLGKQVIWTYQSRVSRAIFSQCKTYSFTKDGKTLLNLQIYACE